ncbi:MAG TPA: DUF2240 family protein [Methanomassiliicoccales archaeon]|nr:DUF2240 family protein [Methanomassiliicoccales archaeon]
MVGREMNSLQQVLALIFKRKGKGVLSEKEFVFSASIDYRWFTPKDAQLLLDLGLKNKLLEKANGFIKPTFDYKKIDVPLDFRPSKDVLSQPSAVDQDKPLFPRMLDEIARHSGMKRRDVVARINHAQERTGVDIEVAALVVAMDLGMEIDNLISEVREEIISR